MTPEQDQELADAAKRIAYLLDYLCRAVKTIADKHLHVSLSDFDPPNRPKH